MGFHDTCVTMDSMFSIISHQHNGARQIRNVFITWMSGIEGTKCVFRATLLAFFLLLNYFLSLCTLFLARSIS